MKYTWWKGKSHKWRKIEGGLIELITLVKSLKNIYEIKSESISSEKEKILEDLFHNTPLNWDYYGMGRISEYGDLIIFSDNSILACFTTLTFSGTFEEHDDKETEWWFGYPISDVTFFN